MNLTSSLLALAGQNFSSSLQDFVGYSYCQGYYGALPNRRDCVKAMDLLEKGTADVTYAVHTGIGPHALPMSKSYGTCMVQIDVAGPRLPATFEIKPDDIRQMAAEVLQECVSGPSKIGGFATSSLDIMDNWLTASMTSFQLPFPTSTAFLTVTLSNFVPDWLSPGDYDPIIPFHFSRVVHAAIDSAFTRRRRLDLIDREVELLQQSARMKPRGNRVAWWIFPPPPPIASAVAAAAGEGGGEEGANGTTGSVDTGSGTVSIELPESSAVGGTVDATSKRRKRRKL